jgi:hypothetical protein
METRQITHVTLSAASEYRIQARRLLNQLRAGDTTTAATAAERFRLLHSFADKTAAQVLAARDHLRLKHALAVVALEQGYDSWRALKAAAEAHARASVVATPQTNREMYARGMDVLLNRWFARYEDARASLEELGGYLLPFDRQFFICEAEGIRILGLDPDDADWALIGWDWVQPQDTAAWQRLRAKRLQVLQGL